MILAFVLSSVYSNLEEQTERNVQADIKKIFSVRLALLLRRESRGLQKMWKKFSKAR